MTSKLTGKYLKQRDQRRGRLSPQSPDDPDITHTDDDIHLSPQVIIKNSGKGEISVSSDWPKDFEKDETTQLMQDRAETSEESNVFPARAMQYLAKSHSYKELTRSKYITVPDPIPTSQREHLVAKTKSSGSVKSFVPFQNLVSHSNRNFTVKSASPRQHATVSKSSQQSHIATIRLRPKHRTVKQGIVTVKPIPRDGTIKTVRGYHLGHNVTVRGHNTGHAIRNLRQLMPSWVAPDETMTFRRVTTLAERKEYYVSQFSIELDNPATESYASGDIISGRVILEVTSDIEIRFVELLIIGIARVSFAKDGANVSKNGQEILINKRSYVMGTPDGRWNSVITAGKYVSQFQFKLPKGIPSTIKYDNREHGFSFEVSYMIKVRICDEIGSTSARSNHSINNYVKVLLTRRFPFIVWQPFDIHAVPKSMQPINHSEYVNLGCLPIFLESAAVSLCLDRSVFLAGDDIHVKLITSNRTAGKVKSLTCKLQQILISNVKPRDIQTYVQLHGNVTDGKPLKQNAKKFTLFEFIIPTHLQLIPSFMSGCKLLTVSYVVVMIVQFKCCEGGLLLECPIGIGPTADPSQIKHTDAAPFFNRVQRFPNFSRDVPNTLKQNGIIHSPDQDIRQINSVIRF